MIFREGGPKCFRTFVCWYTSSKLMIRSPVRSTYVVESMMYVDKEKYKRSGMSSISYFKKLIFWINKDPFLNLTKLAAVHLC